jgi:hypothetical protein
MGDMAGVRAEHSGFMGLVVIGRTRETSSALVGLGLNVHHATGCRIMELCVRCTDSSYGTDIELGVPSLS